MTVAAPPEGEGAAWVGCKCCPEFWCRLHKKHAHECDYPWVETWEQTGLDPYTEGGPKG